MSSSSFVTVGRRLIPRDHIAFVEPYDPGANPGFQTSREYRGRVVMLNRDSNLIEETPEAFAKANSFRVISKDGIAVNPAVHFRVEHFVPADEFKTTKAYATRLLWRDLDGNDQSKLLVSDPEMVLALAVTGEVATADTLADGSAKPARKVPRRRVRLARTYAPQPQA